MAFYSTSEEWLCGCGPPLKTTSSLILTVDSHSNEPLVSFSCVQMVLLEIFRHSNVSFTC